MTQTFPESGHAGRSGYLTWPGQEKSFFFRHLVRICLVYKVLNVQLDNSRRLVMI